MILGLYFSNFFSIKCRISLKLCLNVKIIEYKLIFVKTTSIFVFGILLKAFVMAYMHFCNFSYFNLLLIPSSIQAHFFAILPAPKSQALS